ncbi:hypothetical protein [Mucilaginibacter rubeus]|uniref:Chromosomal replication initiator DnaA C-terminal domain-containing protein n=1 Tax=Mucilaginibacter rubeus TaxID=2027860 RepID=A0A5C1I668_9SPHI|nr:hypothetical protein [Mucilaginibacter rubeus]QEM13449.1 hypothetical protein DEO27_026715 [Mucilaginibacter rubeus]
MDRKIKRVIDGVAKHYPMRKERMLQKQSGNGEPAMARYMAYKMLSEQGIANTEIAISFEMKVENVTKALKRFDDWLTIYPELKKKYELIKAHTLK